jgi:hypothetical protein
MNWKILVPYLVGVATGAFVGYKIAEQRFEEKMEERINSIYETVDKKEKKLQELEDRLNVINKDNQEKAQANLNKPDPEEIVKSHQNEIAEAEFTEYDKMYEPTDKDLVFEEASDDLDAGEVDVNNKSDIEYISATDYGDCEGYTNYIWTYAADGILLDDNNDPIDPVEMTDTLGHDFMDHFGDIDPDELNIRNHTLRLDIKIIPSQKNSYEFNR